MIKLCGLWKKDGEKGVFYSGKLTYGTTIFLFPNKFKRDEKDPDLILSIGEFKKKEDSQSQESAPASEHGDDIPF